MSASTRNRMLALMFGFALAIGLAACSDDDAGTGGDGVTTTVETPEDTGTTETTEDTGTTETT